MSFNTCIIGTRKLDWLESILAQSYITKQQSLAPFEYAHKLVQNFVVASYGQDIGYNNSRYESLFCFCW
jgi:hypothetical protein